MFKNIFQSVDTLTILGIVSMLLFFVSFLFVLYYAWKADGKFIEKMSNMPLEENKLTTNK